MDELKNNCQTTSIFCADCADMDTKKVYCAQFDVMLRTLRLTVHKHMPVKCPECQGWGVIKS